MGFEISYRYLKEVCVGGGLIRYLQLWFSGSGFVLTSENIFLIYVEYGTCYTS